MFQKKIVEKYLSKLDRKLLQQKYELFCSIFKSEKKIENIRNSKEEQYQEGFIRDLFVSVLGYTIKPEENYNILTELKNEVANKSNSKKSDGAICEENNENKVRAVIELKRTDTTDLDLEKFYELDFGAFVKELGKQKIKLSLKQQDEWEEYFNEYKTEIENLSSQVAATDKEINQLVYQFYGLTDEEIAVVEGK